MLRIPMQFFAEPADGAAGAEVQANNPEPTGTAPQGDVQKTEPAPQTGKRAEKV